jgi:hypothetical protein
MSSRISLVALTDGDNENQTTNDITMCFYFCRRRIRTVSNASTQTYDANDNSAIDDDDTLTSGEGSLLNVDFNSTYVVRVFFRENFPRVHSPHPSFRFGLYFRQKSCERADAALSLLAANVTKSQNYL